MNALFCREKSRTWNRKREENHKSASQFVIGNENAEAIKKRRMELNVNVHVSLIRFDCKLHKKLAIAALERVCLSFFNAFFRPGAMAEILFILRGKVSFMWFGGNYGNFFGFERVLLAFHGCSGIFHVLKGFQLDFFFRGFTGFS